MGARAALHYLASCKWKKGSIQDYVRPASAIITACRGLLALNDRSNVEDDLVHESRANNSKAFQICHLSTQIFLARTLSSGRQFHQARLEFVHRILQYILRTLDTIPQLHLTPHIVGQQDRCLGCCFISDNYPLAWYHDIWLHHAESVETFIPVDLVDAYYGHRLYPWLLCHVSPYSTPDQCLVHQAVTLCGHGLGILLKHHLEKHS
ncbi:hypothetical protein BDV98DRAFT_99526 [Pterulicium gracile]|uniref:Uncharacterized protein n=1 Tax=Pterulicium gracile TaxID=1884261 RepID=A0A5C3QFY4_9AGAR|nr:hypothetical protein BDV98DRAFT_99526 [Pterula gracilis]